MAIVPSSVMKSRRLISLTLGRHRTISDGAIVHHRKIEGSRSDLGHERHPVHRTGACQFPLYHVGDRGSGAVQYVAKGHFRTHAPQQRSVIVGAR